MRIIEDTKYDFSDVLIVPKRSSLTSRKDVSLERKYEFINSGGLYHGIPIISSNMSHTGTIEMADALAKFDISTAIHKHYSEDELVDYFGQHGKLSSFYSMGISDDDYIKFKKVFERVDYNIDKICIDVANGYTVQFERFVSKIREELPDMIIMAGSVVTPEMTEQLIHSGADIIRVGIGSGSVCTTRKKTGVGYPQLSAVIECADAAHGLKGHVVSDGGSQMPGDVSKAFGAGADFVMLGGMFAGHEEGGGDEYWDFGKKYIKFHGMSSESAMKKYAGGVAEYRASEGKEVFVPYRGAVENTVKEILGGLRSTCTYVGAKTLKELPKRTTFIKVHRTHNTVFGDEK